MDRRGKVEATVGPLGLQGEMLSDVVAAEPVSAAGDPMSEVEGENG